MQKIITFLINKAKNVFYLSLFICLLFSFFAFKIQIEAKSTSFFLENDKDLIKFNKSIQTFGEQDFLVLAYKNNDSVFTQKNIDFLKKIKNELEQIKGVDSTLSILNAPLFLNDKKNILAGANIKKAQEEIMQNNFYVSNIISKDLKVADFLIYSKNPNAILSDLRLLAEQNGLILGGISVIADDMVSYVKSDLKYYGIGLVILLSLAVFIFFRSYYFVFICMFICLISLFTSTGILYLLDYKITVISSNYVALVLIITISVVIHLLSHFAELQNYNLFSDRKQKIRHTLLAKAKPSFYAILTTVVGFLSLVFSGIKPISELGVMMSIGICISLLLAYLFLPYLLLVKQDLSSVYFSKKTKFLAFCANTAIYHRKIIYFICVLVVFSACILIPKLSAENSFVNYFKDSSEIKKGLLLIDENLGGTLPLDVIISFKNDNNNSLEDDELSEFEAEFNNDKYYLTPEKISIISKIQDYLKNNKYIGSSLSLASLSEFAKNINNNKELDTFLMNALLNNLDEDTKKQIIYPYYNEKTKEFRIALRIIDSSKELRRAEFIKELKSDLSKIAKENNLNIELSGVMILYNNMLASLISSQVDTLNVVVLSIFVLFLIIFKNIRFSIIGILANVIPLSLLFTIIAFFDLKLDLMSITIAAISIGIGVDDIIHYVHRFKQEIKQNSLEKAIIKSHQSIGSALYFTTCTICLGFCLMVSSNFIPTIYFGLLTLMVMILLLSGSLFLLPSLIITFYFKGYFKNESKEGRQK